MNTTYKETRLSPTLTLRPVRWTDLETVTKLIYDVCEADGDTTVAVTSEELKLEWLTPGFNLETDAYLVETEDGQIVGFEEFNNRHKHATLETDGYVHPKFTGQAQAGIRSVWRKQVPTPYQRRPVEDSPSFPLQASSTHPSNLAWLFPNVDVGSHWRAGNVDNARRSDLNFVHPFPAMHQPFQCGSMYRVSDRKNNADS